ncbi:hypothetical protein SAMN02910357_02088 [Succinivibrio dextrinosolvens]|uniref:hypothetical protein n=1 Tax=Succinivibrio dextrinosolvens TaxID=83771 RepID=UPI0008E0E639|nr:hypothetical protein [Succinivibrio dextrinosolvens]SFS83129.1 hypothetical protein SAMN02910357_02088 [Succinivibrio dextrinosolvens]
MRRRSEAEEIIRQKKEFAKAKAENEFLKKSYSVLCQEPVATYAFIKQCNDDRLRGTNISLIRAAELLEVSVSGFYKWLNDEDKEHRDGEIHTDAEVLVAIQEVIKDSCNNVPGPSECIMN